MKSAGSTLIAFVVASCVHAAQPAPSAPKFDSARAFEDLKQIVALGPRPSGSPALQQTRDYIRKQLEATGLTVVEQPFDAQTPLGTIKMVNLRATLPGKGPGRILVTGHYDTKPFKEFTFVGANDGGSSAAFLIEFARALKGRSNPLPIELVFLDGEESTGEWQGDDHTYGSRHYVQAAKTAGDLKDIRAMILVDMIGDAQLEIKREGNSTPWLTDAIWSAARKLNRREFSDVVTRIEDDHLEFLEAGVPSVDLIDLEYPNAMNPGGYWHTAEDTLAHVSPKSLQAVGDVLLAALPAIELRVSGAR